MLTELKQQDRKAHPSSAWVKIRGALHLFPTDLSSWHGV
jgi:hypothetical protein